MGARSLLESLRLVEGTEETCDQVLVIMSQMAEDPEGTVRTELMEQVPHIAMYCHENSHNFSACPARTFILPIVVKYLTDCNNQVRKTSQAALLVLLEQELIQKDDVELQVCPVILDLAQKESVDDFRTEAVALMSKLAPLVGQDITRRIFLPRFAELCTDALFHVRKVCAANFGDMCTVVGQLSTQEVLLPKFYYLCEDGVWGVRKACAECFMQVSCACSQEVRRTELAQLFISLVCDQSRWVRMSAFQALGGFISTFADPSVTGLYFNEDGTLVSANPDEFLSTKDEDEEVVVEEEEEAGGGDSSSPAESPVVPVSTDNCDNNNKVIAMDIEDEQSCDTSSPDEGPSLEEKRAEDYKQRQEASNNNKPLLESLQLPAEDSDPFIEDVQSPESFTSFIFWREPLPELPDKDIQRLSTPEQEQAGAFPGAEVDDLTRQLNTADLLSSEDKVETVANIGSEHVLGQLVGETTLTIKNGVVEDVSGSASLGYCPAEDTGSVHSSEEADDKAMLNQAMLDQDVIPQGLLDHYLSMTDPLRAQTVEAEIAKHCAYSLPAVAYTLGRRHWPCLKNLYDTLAADMQWKVRRTLAFSIHELAVIVGEDITGRDLVPVFNGFLKDLDEVRIGVLKHLAEFLRLLKPEIRQEYLTKLAEFLKTDNHRNWRFRAELAEQLLVLLDLFTADDVGDFVTPVAMILATDRVAEVRLTAFRALSGIMKSVAHDNQLLTSMVRRLKQNFAEHHRWCQRQMFAHLCQCILEDKSLSAERYATELLPELLKLHADPIPNVRISVARVMAYQILKSDYLTSAQNPHHCDLLEACTSLKGDTDRDVRYYFSQSAYNSDMVPQDSDFIDMIPV
ncbi:hypothetical protein CAPTEDRAFT_156976 [Capitella teleta]|uniref:Uncharacterized protein n=1 Tax=Capitella teleta TaxID=283909 RepID=R7T4P6_CAPTE|nr:hypothetical protein CAPTEDRAFT_156976 [Capitella teleta]|eukprot:ELT87826.1 hypothetical protein CAPTEDRAFT_156976 [Capitella teleta]